MTGASAGVGRAVAREFGRRGHSVGLVARGKDGLAAAQSELETAGADALAVPTDVADAEQVEAAAERIETKLGPIDVWVNDAMATVFAPVQRVTAEEFRRATEVTYLGTVHGTMAALRRMRPRNRGTIVQVGSALAYRSLPLQAAYCGAKHAIKGFTESLRCELLHERSHVRVTMVHLPALNTPQFTLGRTKMPRQPQPVPPIFEPEVAADAVVWAAEARRREVFVGGSTVLAVVGGKLVPGLGDLYLARTGYDAQQTDEPVDEDRPDNLFAPVPGDHGAHGIFDRRAHDRSLQLWMTKHRGWIGLAAAGALAAWLVRD
ncbi:MAG TPA: SDR family oxidoreductase [Gaiellaceae bacterium]|nr:SDR family oxidoreductase [Gaiellaceae bacterium]